MKTGINRARKNRASGFLKGIAVRGGLRAAASGYFQFVCIRMTSVSEVKKDICNNIERTKQ